MFIWHFGPPILFSTECFKSFDHVFQLASIYSNRQAPSQGMCRVFSEQDAVKHIVSDGFWLDPRTQAPWNTSVDIHAYMQSHPEQHHFIDIPTVIEKEVGESQSFSQMAIEDRIITGTSCLLMQWGQDNQSDVVPHVEWCKTQSAMIQQSGLSRNSATDLFYKGKTFLTMDGDNACLDGHIIFQLDAANPDEVCRLSLFLHWCILSPVSASFQLE